MADSSVPITAGTGTPIRVLTGLGAGNADQQVVTLADSAGNLLGTAGAPVPVGQGTASNVNNGWPTIGGELAADATGSFTSGSGLLATVSTAQVAASIDGYNSCLVSISGTFTGASGFFEYTDDGGTTWFTCGAVRGDGSGLVDRSYTSLSSAQTWFVNVGGADAIRVRNAAVGTGTVNVRISTLSHAIPGALPHGVSLLPGTSYVGSHALTSPASAPFGIYGNLNPYGTQRVTVEPTLMFIETADAALDTTNKWALGGTQTPSISAGNIVLAPTVGTNLTNSATMNSLPLFTSPGVSFLTFSCVVTLEAAQTNAVNVYRFWGKGNATTNTYAAPVTEGAGFEVEPTSGALQCVVYVGGVRFVINSTTAGNITSSLSGQVAGGSPAGLPLPTGVTATAYGKSLTWAGGAHRYAIMVRSDVIYWFIEGTEVPVAAVSYLSPQTQGVPVRIASFTNPAGTSLAHTFTVNAIAVNDNSAQNHTISDANLPFQRLWVSRDGQPSVAGGNSPLLKGRTPLVNGVGVTGVAHDLLSSDVGVLGTLPIAPFTNGSASMNAGNVRVSTAAAITTSTQLVAAPGTGLSIYVTDFGVTNTGTTGALVTLTSGTGVTGTTGILDLFAAATASPAPRALRVPIKLPAATALGYNVSAASTTVFTAVSYFIAP